MNSLSEFVAFAEILALLSDTEIEFSKQDERGNRAVYEAWENAAGKAWEAVIAVGDAFLEYQCALALTPLK